jgi:hypothetical protein
VAAKRICHIRAQARGIVSESEHLAHRIGDCRESCRCIVAKRQTIPVGVTDFRQEWLLRVSARRTAIHINTAVPEAELKMIVGQARQCVENPVRLKSLFENCFSLVS